MKFYTQNSEFNEKLFTEVRENHNTKLLFDPVGKINLQSLLVILFLNTILNRPSNLEVEKYLVSFANIITKNIQRVWH